MQGLEYEAGFFSEDIPRPRYWNLEGNYFFGLWASPTVLTWMMPPGEWGMDSQALHCYETSHKGCCVFIFVTPRRDFLNVVRKYIKGVIGYRPQQGFWYSHLPRHGCKIFCSIQIMCWDGFDLSLILSHKKKWRWQLRWTDTPLNFFEDWDRLPLPNCCRLGFLWLLEAPLPQWKCGVSSDVGLSGGGLMFFQPRKL